MTPTLLLGEHFEAELEAYESSSPSVGDVVIFPAARGPGGAIFPRDERPDLPTDLFSKRVIGVPGDVIEFRNGQLFRNEVEVPEAPTGRTQRTCSRYDPQVFESIVGGHAFQIARDDERPEPDGPRTEVPAGRLYVLGDYRNRSNDSRIWGTVRVADVVGKVTRRIGGEAASSCPQLPSRVGTAIQWFSAL